MTGSPAAGSAEPPGADAPDVVALRGVTVREGGVDIVHDVDLVVRRREHHVLLGPNGSGKTTLLRVIAGYRHPTSGTAEVLGERFGHTDIRLLRRRIGMVSTALGDLLHTRARVEALVMAAAFGVTRPTAAHTGDPALREHAEQTLSRVGAAHLIGRRADTLSQGEWQRVQIARSLVHDPALLLLDEPMVGLDVGAREAMIGDLAGLLTEPGGPTVVLVTHHLEEIPPGIGAAVLLRDGRVAAAGPVEEAVTGPSMSAAFGVPLAVHRHEGRLHAVLADPTPP